MGSTCLLGSACLVVLPFLVGFAPAKDTPQQEYFTFGPTVYQPLHSYPERVEGRLAERPFGRLVLLIVTIAPALFIRVVD
jgi:hypothetical protein